jgi:creatinine amidohydrolase
MQRFDDSCTSPAISAGNPTMAVWGIGAIEQHSIHLPLGTDWLAVREIAARVAEDLGAFLVPALPFSMSQCHGPMAGTVWLKPKTLAAVVRDVVRSLRAQGIDKIILINGHGGNFVLEAVMRELNLSESGLQFVMPAGEMVIGLDRPVFETSHLEVHAGESETSFHLALNPEWVKDECVDYLPPVGREFLDYAFISAISPAGVWGYPKKASAEKGHAGLALQVRAIAEGARKTFAALDALSAAKQETRHDA